MSESSKEDLARRVDAIEAGYELMLAYAAQGATSDAASANGAQLREFLGRFERALTGLTEAFRGVIIADGRDPGIYDAFLDVLARDSQSSQAGLRMVMAQSSISSQTIDNLNASLHVRALLTDVFLMDELLKP